MGSRRIIAEEMNKILTNLDPRWVRAGTVEVLENLSTLIFKRGLGEIGVVCAFVSRDGEPDLSDFVSSILGEKEVYLPRKTGTAPLRFVKVGVSQEGFSGDEDIGSVFEERMEYLRGQIVVLVPALAFDRRGYFIEHEGAGYIKLLTERAFHSAIKIGVGWSLQMLPSLPIRDDDPSLDYICHEEGIVVAEGNKG